MQSNRISGDDAAAIFAGLGIVVLLIALVVGLAVFLFLSYCYKRICENGGHQPGVLVWIPFVRMIPLIQSAGLPLWMFILTLVPFVNYVFFIFLFWKLCEGCGKPGALALLLIFTPLLLILAPVLAFTGARPHAAPPATT